MPLSEVKLKSAMGRLSLTALAISSFTPSCDAFFRNLMISDTAMARVDPIVDRGEAAAHVHHLNGGGSKYESSFDPSLTDIIRRSQL